MKRELKKVSVLVGIFLIAIVRIHANCTRILPDRNIYVSGEEVLMSVLFSEDCNFKVVNICIVNTKGVHIQPVNLAVSNYCASGHIYLPDSLTSGSYLLTAFSPHLEPKILDQREIIILNRFHNTESAIQLYRPELPAIETLPVPEFTISGLKKQFKQNETVELTLDGQVDTLSRLFVSVSRCFPDWVPRHQSLDYGYSDTLLLTRRRGVVVKGKVQQVKSNEPVEGAFVYLSIADSIPCFDYYKTRDDGRFYFVLEDRYDLNHLVLQAQKKGETNKLKLEVETNGQHSLHGFNAANFPVDPALHNYLTESVQLVTFQKVFQATELDVVPMKNKNRFSIPFYGKAAQVVYPDEYFELDDFNEISKELLQFVRFRKNKTNYTLDILDADQMFVMNEGNMILLDGVPITDLSILANLRTKDIERVEVMPYQRYYGDLCMNGVVAVYTKSNDASLISPSNHLKKIDFEALQNQVQLPKAKSSAGNEPDFSQVLYWNPAFDSRSERTIRFRTPNVNGTYRVSILERSADKHLYERTLFFTVDNSL